ncbi:MAG TPA: cytochrome c biogenesis protein DipZ [Solirubrobacterales bacterium]|nr:cytochrome c biogenesis protein DipZ [Solirubrobacterales bacterium]
MALLIIFGFVAGAATALSPCVLPVLPIALSAGATGGRRRPLGIVIGLAVSFTFATVALVYVISALGLPNDFLRKFAIVVLLGFGITLMIPPLAARLEAWMSQFAGRAGVHSSGDGFWSGTAVGASLGLVYAPCAGPILAGVITVSASQSFSTGRLAVALSYGIGSAVVLYFLMLGGRKLIAPLARRGVGLQIAMGAVMVVVALAMLGNYDIRFQSKIAADLPSFLVNPSEALEDTASAQDALVDLRGGGHGVGSKESGKAPEAAEGGLDLPVLGQAPDFVGNQRWFNTPGGKPLSLAELRGRVVLVDFWTYSCINCIRTFPYLKAWDKRYRKDGLTIVGVHAPEFPFEKEASNVEDAIETNGIRYPVAQDNDLATWSAYGNQYWPAEYFIDAEGNVRYTHFGEGEYEEKEAVIRQLLTEAGSEVGSSRAGGQGIEAAAGVTTPETYLGAARAEGFTNGAIAPGLHDFKAPEGLPDNALAYHGPWRVTLDSATAEGGSLDLNFGARRVYLVLGSPDRAREVKVMLDGKPIPAAAAGSDVEGGAVTVSKQRLYNLVDLPKVGHHVLELQPEQGVTGYAFTFG